MSRVFRFALSHLKASHIQFIAPSSEETYNTWVDNPRRGISGDTRKLKRDVERLPTVPEIPLMWVGDRQRASKFVLFFHGGGFIAPLGDGHLNWCWNAYIKHRRDHEVAVAVLAYSLAPEAKYPVQLQQACAAVQCLLNAGIEPRDLIIGGDSAGANLVNQLLCHVDKPVPGVEPINFMGRQLAGIFLVSPWVSGRINTRSFYENDTVDMLSESIVQTTGTQVLRRIDTETKHGAPHPVLPLDGDLSWLGNINNYTKAFYVTCGGLEVFRDDVIAFYEAVRRRNSGSSLSLRLEAPPDEIHDSILLEGACSIDGDATRRMREWTDSRFSN